MIDLLLQMYQLFDCTETCIKSQGMYEEEKKMSLSTKRMIILTVIVVIAFVLGRLAVRAFMNLLLGGTLFGGNLL